MKRTHLLLLVVGLVFVVALGLRVFNELDGPASLPADEGRSTRRLVSIGMPRDYVADPLVSAHEMDRGPQRIISLAPNITEIVCSLGMRGRLVGRTQFCKYPPGLESVAQVGAFMDTNFAKIKSLKPDLVLTTTNSGMVIDKLRTLGLPYKTVPHGSVEDVYEAIALIGKAVERPQTAEALIAAIQDDIELLQESVADLNMPSRRLLVVLGPLPVPPKATYVAGLASFLDNLIKMAGHTNVAGEVLKDSFCEISLEILRVLNPEVILEFREEWSAQQVADLYTSWSEVGTLQAIQNRRVRSIGGPEWLSAGPRIALELHRFITVLSEFR
ncbi:MAG: ABC transporter substrate-binding protein [Planctomycetota bacterium]|jgi:iron complex transport system substrate-binding protein